MNKQGFWRTSLPMIGSCVLFGLSYPAVKIGVSEVSAFSLLMWRFIFSFAVLCAGMLIGGIRISFKGRPFLPVLMIAVFQPVLYFLFATYGIGMTTVSESGTIAACMPIVSIILSGIMLRERPSSKQVAGIVISVLGVILVGLVKGQSPSFSAAGYALLILAMFSDSASVIFIRKDVEHTQFEQTFIMSLTGTILFTICAVAENTMSGTLPELIKLPFSNVRFLICILYLSIGCQVLAFYLSNLAYSRLGVPRVASFSGTVTIVSVLTGVIFLGDDFSLMQGIGTVMVVIGIYVANHSIAVKEGNGYERKDKETKRDKRA